MTVVSAANQSAQTAQNAQTASRSSLSSLSANYELFLSILTTQIQNQDPLDPLDSAEYTSQLVQYSSVEQAIQTNSYLEDLIAATQSSQAASYVSYIGNEVTASGDTTMFANGKASWNYELSEDAAGTFEIRNSAGAVVYSADLTLEAGDGTFNWDGTTDSGGTAADGAYTVSFKLTDADGNSETVTTNMTGIVDGVDVSSGEAFLIIGDTRIPVSAVRSVVSPS